MTPLHPSRSLGLIFPMRSEAIQVMGREGWRHADVGGLKSLETSGGRRVLGVQCGISRSRVVAAVDHLAGQGVAALGCLGIGAGLDPELLPGSVVLASEVVSHERGDIPRWMHTDPDLGQKLSHCFQAGGLPAVTGPIWSSRIAMTRHREKALLFEQYKVVTADMESAWIGDRAMKAGIPWFILRTVCDPAGMDVPWQFSRMLTATGRINIPALVYHVARYPGLLRKMPSMARCYRVALAALRSAREIGTEALD